MRRFPNVRMAGEVILSHQAQQANEHDRGPGPVWDRVIHLLSGLSMDQVNELGGYRIFETIVRTLYESAALN
jgi:hypothetical protein